jgi:hypothetical protein
MRGVKLTVAPTGLHSNIEFDGKGIGARRFILDTQYDGISKLTIEGTAWPEAGEQVIEGYFIGLDELSEAAIADLVRRLRERLPTAG